MARDIIKRHGRFIKSDDPLRKVLNITDFNLMDICDKPFTFHDNASANIIHRKLHHVMDLAETIRESHEIDSTFAHENRPVIRPLDFTDEWRRQKRRMANRNQRLEDEEELELETQREQFDWPTAKFGPLPEVMPPLYPFFVPLGIKVVVQEEASPEKTTPLKISHPEAVQQTKRHEAPPAPEPQLAKAAPPTPDVFVPMHPATPVIDEAALEALREAARAEGYRQGFELGEEKGTMQAQGTAQKVLSELSLVVDNLQGMQQSILTNVQDNFIKICESFIETLLHKEFKLNPDSFGRIIERAIQEAVPEDEIKIMVSPQVLESLSQWSDKDLLAKLRPDDALHDYEFRIESKNSIVDAKLSTLIKRLLDQADLQLFEDPIKERAS